MTSVAVNPPRTPVTQGSNGVAAATLPNVCKMPGPPAPFVPTPLPNIGRSGLKPKGYSKRVKISGKGVAIGNASFGSQGDAASKATGGGLVSANTHGPTRFLSPGSMDVSFEGKPVHLLSDMTFNNCGPSGTPPNAATMGGLLQAAKLKNPDNVSVCGAGKHTEVIEYPEVPEAEQDPNERVKAMEAASKNLKGSIYEVKAARHNIKSGTITHGRQLSRELTTQEEASGADPDDQKAMAICSACGFRRELDHVVDDRNFVEVKSSSKAIKSGPQMTNNAALVTKGAAVNYKSPPLGRQKLAWLVGQGFGHIAV